MVKWKQQLQSNRWLIYCENMDIVGLFWVELLEISKFKLEELLITEQNRRVEMAMVCSSSIFWKNIISNIAKKKA